MQALKSELDKVSPSLGRSAVYLKEPQINKLPRYDPTLKAVVITCTEELAYQQAKEADNLLQKGVYLGNSSNPSTQIDTLQVGMVGKLVDGLQDKIQLVPIDLWKRPAWYKEKVYPENKGLSREVIPLYDGFGVSIMWAVLTVVVVFEFTVGATLSKGLNRGFATFLVGGLGVGAHHLATFAGETGEPILFGSFVFILVSNILRMPQLPQRSFSRFFPAIKARYDYDVLVFILTFDLVSVSGYRVDRIIELAHRRLSTILIGGLTCVLISVGVRLYGVVKSFTDLEMNFLSAKRMIRGFGDEFFECKENDQRSDEIVSKDDKSFLQRYKSVLNSKPSEELILRVGSPGHGSFKFRHPWTQDWQ
ncbi:hypothetical protein Syun_023348 [Stephania yunnanensis]|uniref:Uncharacterized protein n=1 Tax=Stephania yunnanensis TaxID=152371 RepID=A0AAP0I274_9MAGN